jgi:hypothetical protein
MDFTDAILKKPEVLRQNPDIAQLMFTSTSKIVSLAQTATHESDLEDGPVNSHSNENAQIDRRTLSTQLPDDNSESTPPIVSNALPVLIQTNSDRGTRVIASVMTTGI